MTQQLIIERDARGVVTLSLNRPDVHNAFDDKLIAELTATLRELNDDKDVRLVVLTGTGKSFSAGADLNWMRSMAGFSHVENVADAQRLADLLHTLNSLSKATVARVNGHAFGGAVGLLSACDIVVARTGVKFALSEVRLGLAPAVISPYVIAAIGGRQARRFILTGEAFDTDTALRIGLVHAAVDADELDAAVETQCELLLGGGPQAQRACKTLIAYVLANASDIGSLDRYTTTLIADLRASAEGQDGIGAFLGKRRPKWLE